MATLWTGDVHFTVGVVFDSMLDRGNEASQGNTLESPRGSTDLDQESIWSHYGNCSLSRLIKCPNIIMLIMSSTIVSYTIGLLGTLWIPNWPTWTACGHLFSKSSNKYEKPGQDLHLNAIDSASNRHEKNSPLLKVCFKVADQRYLHIKLWGDVDPQIPEIWPGIQRPSHRMGSVEKCSFEKIFFCVNHEWCRSIKKCCRSR